MFDYKLAIEMPAAAKGGLSPSDVNAHEKLT
jgi:hypothetical protein